MLKYSLKIKTGKDSLSKQQRQQRKVIKQDMDIESKRKSYLLKWTRKRYIEQLIFLTYHKEVRDGWFWHIFGMSADVKIRETSLKMTKGYQELISKRSITFAEYCVHHQEQEK